MKTMQCKSCCLRKNANQSIPCAIMKFQLGHVCNRFLERFAELKTASSCFKHTKLEGDAKTTFLLAFSPDRSKLASTHGDHTIRIFDVRTGKLLNVLRGHQRSPWCLSFHPIHNNIIASGCLSGEIRIWDLENGTNQVYSITNGTVIASLAFHPIDDLLAIATDSNLLFLDWKTGTVIHSLKTVDAKQRVRLVKFDRLGNWMLTGITNKEDIACEPAIPEERSSFQREESSSVEGNVNCFVLSQRGNQTNARRVTRREGDTAGDEALRGCNRTSYQLSGSASQSQPVTSGNDVSNDTLASSDQLENDTRSRESSKNTAHSSAQTLLQNSSSCSQAASSDSVVNTGNSVSETNNSGASRLKTDNEHPMINEQLQSVRQNTNDTTGSRYDTGGTDSNGFINTTVQRNFDGGSNTSLHNHSSSPLRSQMYNLRMNILGSENDNPRPSMSQLRGYDYFRTGTEGDEEIPVYSLVSRRLEPVRTSDGALSTQHENHTVATATARTAGHMYTAVVIADRNEDESQTALRTAINRAIAGAFASNGQTAVASNIINTTYRLQYWDLNRNTMPDLTKTTANVIVPSCKLYNDGSIDVSDNDTLLAAFIPSSSGFPDNGMVRVFSLCKENFGQCLFSHSFGPNLISLSFSPLSTYLLVGLASRKMHIAGSQNELVGQILKLPGNGKRSISDCDSKSVLTVEHPKNLHNDGPISVNTVKFHPVPGVGLIYGTNKGSVWHCKIGQEDGRK